jgi:hypothetical protein
MEKSKLEKFISKYNLGGSCESVVFKVDGNSLSTRAISDDKNVLCEVTGPAMGLAAGEYAVYETHKLKSLLGVLGDTLSVDVKRTKTQQGDLFGDKVVGLTFDDKNTEVTFVLADTSVIPSVPELKKLPPFDLTITMDEQFITTFVKAKTALADVDLYRD